MNRQTELFAIASMFLTVAILASTAIFGPALTDIQSKGVYEFIKDWQTLIGGVLAFVAAAVAAAPVWSQLQKINVQSAVMSRGVLAERLKQVEKRLTQTSEMLRDMTEEFEARIVINFDNDPSQIDSHWAFDAQQTVQQALAVLRAQQDSKADTERVDHQRAKVVLLAHSLEQCLENIHLPDSGYLDDPEYPISEDERREIENAAVLSRSEIFDRVLAVAEGADKLRSALKNEADELRLRIRKIDDLIVVNAIDV